MRKSSFNKIQLLSSFFLRISTYFLREIFLNNMVIVRLRETARKLKSSLRNKLFYVAKQQVIREPYYQETTLDNNQQLIREHFLKNGYVVIPNILSQDQVISLRKICQEYVKESGEKEMLSSHFLSIQELAVIPFNFGVIKTLTSILGKNYTTYPNFKMAADLYTCWHIDNNYRPNFYDDRDEFLYSPEFLHAQCIIYLQENHEIFGGGLDIVPRSHSNLISLGGTQSIYARMTRKITNLIRQPISLKTQAGDLIIFDIRLLHRGTQPKSSPKFRKYAISWSTSRTNHEQITRFMLYYLTRKNYLEELDIKKTSFHQSIIKKYEDILQINFPNDYPNIVVNLAKKQGLNIESYQDKYLTLLNHV